MRQKHLILTGACYLDTILDIPFFPAEDAKLRATGLTTRRGGNCPNSLEVLQQLLRKRNDEHTQIRPYLVTCLPGRTTAASQRVAASFGPNSPVDLSHCIYREDRIEPASCYVLRCADTGSRTVVNHNDLEDMSTAEFEGVVQSFAPDQDTWWHFEGRIPGTTMACIRLIRARLPHATVSVEVEKPGRQGLTELAAEADVVFYSRTWAENRGHGSAEACLRSQDIPRASLALCTWGSEGAMALSRPAGQMIRCPAVRAAAVVDAVGAGDTFVAGMLYGLLCHGDGWDTEQKVAFAVRLASLKVQREGFDGLAEAIGSLL